jgi:hypothetical protein
MAKVRPSSAGAVSRCVVSKTMAPPTMVDTVDVGGRRLPNRATWASDGIHARRRAEFVNLAKVCQVMGNNICLLRMRRNDVPSAVPYMVSLFFLGHPPVHLNHHFVTFTTAPQLQHPSSTTGAPSCHGQSVLLAPSNAITVLLGPPVIPPRIHIAHPLRRGLP